MYTYQDEIIRIKTCSSCGLTYNTLQESEIILDDKEYRIYYYPATTQEYHNKMVEIKRTPRQS